jgi:anti-sigma factor RsiW
MGTTRVPTRRFLVNVSLPCAKPSLRRLLPDYLDDKLSNKEREHFRRHLLGCLACAADVYNAKAVAEAGAQAHPNRALTPPESSSRRAR